MQVDQSCYAPVITYRDVRHVKWITLLASLLSPHTLRKSHPVTGRPLLSILLPLWCIAMGAAFYVDRPVATWVRDHPPVNKNDHRTHLVLDTLKRPGWFPFTLCIAALVGVLHTRQLTAAAAVALSGIVGGLAYCIIKWTVGRHRPVTAIAPFQLHPFPGGIRGLFVSEPGLSFPSGHATLAFATAMCLAMLLPRWSVVFFVIAIATAIERVIENAHYVSDVVAGAGLGVMAGSWVTSGVFRTWPQNTKSSI